MAKREKRTPNLDIRFGEGETGNAIGWFFQVEEIFREAMDIKFTERRIRDRGSSTSTSIWMWTQGIPPQLAFDIGDVFYDYPCARKEDWATVRHRIRFCISINAAAPDQLRNGKVMSGFVEFDLFHFRSGKIQKTEKLNVTQNQFLDFLRTGLIRDIVDLTTTNHG